MTKKTSKKKLSKKDETEMLSVLKERFEKNMKRHKGLVWEKIEGKLVKQSGKIRSLHQMEETGGEPDVVSYDKKTDEYIFYDCSPETPKGRRSLCYDEPARKSRKEHAPDSSAVGMAMSMEIELLTEAEYRALQKLGDFDMKTSSWLRTPDLIRKLGGAIFADFRFETVFVYHNGVESYYGGRGFRGSLRV